MEQVAQRFKRKLRSLYLQDAKTLKWVFADSHYWEALANPNDQWYQAAKNAEDALGDHGLITTEGILTEFLGAYSGWGEHFRKIAIQGVRAILNNPNVDVIPQTRELFLKGLGLYENREDKGYSLVDCCSMVVMKERNLTEILTNDHHFEQERFTILIKG